MALLRSRVSLLALTVFGLLVSACGSAEEAPELLAGTYRVSLAVRQNSATCRAATSAPPLAPFSSRPDFVDLADASDGRKVVAFCTNSSTSCEQVGTVKLDPSYSPAAWVGEVRTAQRIDANTCRVQVAYVSIVAVKLSNFQSRDRVRVQRVTYEADYPRAGETASDCRPEDYKGALGCKYEEIIEGSPEST